MLEDTLVLAAAKGPSLLKDVMQMHEKHRASPSARSAKSSHVPISLIEGPAHETDGVLYETLAGAVALGAVNLALNPKP